jgi:hypothetical protein
MPITCRSSLAHGEIRPPWETDRDMARGQGIVGQPAGTHGVVHDPLGCSRRATVTSVGTTSQELADQRAIGTFEWPVVMVRRGKPAAIVNVVCH